jgi:CPA2 family monovalent cation:H+ antiporter-2
MLFLVLDRLKPWIDRYDGAIDAAKPAEKAPEETIVPTTLEDHAVLVGHGRVGHRIGGALLDAGIPLFVIDESEDVVTELKAKGIEAVVANAVTSLAAANLPKARCLLVAIHENFEAGQIVAQARAISPDLVILARGHSSAEQEHLKSCGATSVVLGAEEIAAAMMRSYWTIIPSGGSTS